MKVNVSVLSWIQKEKPGIWWHFVLEAKCPVSAICCFIASGVSH